MQIESQHDPLRHAFANFRRVPIGIEFMAGFLAQPLRRWALVVFLAFALGLVLKQLSFRFGTSRGVSGLKIPVYTPTPKINDGQFHWTHVPTEYRHSSLQALPAGNPQKLPKIQVKVNARPLMRKPRGLQQMLAKLLQKARQSVSF